MKKICMVAYALYFTDARVKAYVRSLVGRGYQVDIIALKEPGRSPESPLPGNVRIFQVSGKYTGASKIHYLLSYLIFFCRSIALVSILYIINGYRVIHVHNMPNFIVFAAFLPRIFGSMVILDMHDILSQTLRERYGSRGLMYPVARLEERLSAAFAHKLICADDFQAEFLRSQVKVGAQKLTVVFNLPDLMVFRRTSHSTDRGGQVLNVVYHGTITYRLGIDIILKAIARVRKVIPVRFHLFGSGDFLGDCMAMIAREDLGKTVAASGRFFSVEELPGLINGMDLGIIGNRQCDATKYMLPVKMMEYMALGIPVLAPSLENIAHYFRNGEVHFYKPGDSVDLAEKIVFLYQHRDIMDDIGKKGQDYARRNNWSNEEAKYFKMLGL